MPSLRDKMQEHVHHSRAHMPGAWCEGLTDVEPNLGAIPENARLERNARIVPEPDRAFFALEGIAPADVRVAVIGNDPYPHPDRATGRSFEQGDLTNWIQDLPVSRLVTPSLLTLVWAVATLYPNAGALGLDECRLKKRKERLTYALQNGLGLLPQRLMFDHSTRQGVLWLNRTPTIKVSPSGDGWKSNNRHREWFRKLWDPVTCAIISSLIQEALQRPIVFALFGKRAKEMQVSISAEGCREDVPCKNLRFVESGHPSLAHLFFCSGRNPLKQINSELADPIDWCCRQMGPQRTA